MSCRTEDLFCRGISSRVAGQWLQAAWPRRVDASLPGTWLPGRCLTPHHRVCQCSIGPRQRILWPWDGAAVQRAPRLVASQHHWSHHVGAEGSLRRQYLQTGILYVLLNSLIAIYSHLCYLPNGNFRLFIGIFGIWIGLIVEPIALLIHPRSIALSTTIQRTFLIKLVFHSFSFMPSWTHCWKSISPQ